MKEFKLDYDKILFLYAYLRQADLSIDRSRWDSLDKLKNYYKKNIMPKQMLKYLIKELEIKKTNYTDFIYKPKSKTAMKKLKDSLFNKTVLDEDEVLYCCQLLSSFEQILKSNFTDFNLEIEKLRTSIAMFYNESLEPMLLKKDLLTVMKIEHYEQSDNIDTVDMTKFITTNFTF